MRVSFETKSELARYTTFIHSLISWAIETPFYDEMLGVHFIQMLSAGRIDETVQTVAEQQNPPQMHHWSRVLMRPWCRMNVIKREKHRRAHQGVVKRAHYTNCKSRVESGLMQVLLRDIPDYKTVTQRMSHAHRDVFGIFLLS